MYGRKHFDRDTLPTGSDPPGSLNRMFYYEMVVYRANVKSLFVSVTLNKGIEISGGRRV